MFQVEILLPTTLHRESSWYSYEIQCSKFQSGTNSSTQENCQALALKKETIKLTICSIFRDINEIQNFLWKWQTWQIFHLKSTDLRKLEKEKKCHPQPPSLPFSSMAASSPLPVRQSRNLSSLPPTTLSDPRPPPPLDPPRHGRLSSPPAAPPQLPAGSGTTACRSWGCPIRGWRPR
jgi:hypothetical protein